jgi:phosphatidate phosphatase APP1
MHLKPFRWKDSSFLNLFASSLETKPPVIESILERWPRRTIILVGDSGEYDPEIYGAIARAYPDRVTAILIRDVTGEATDAPRYRKAFADLPVERCVVIDDEGLEYIDVLLAPQLATDPPP